MVEIIDTYGDEFGWAPDRRLQLHIGRGIARRGIGCQRRHESCSGLWRRGKPAFDDGGIPQRAGIDHLIVEQHTRSQLAVAMTKRDQAHSVPPSSTTSIACPV